MKEFLISYLEGVAVALTPSMVAFLVSKHPSLWRKLRKWRCWANVPYSWITCVMIAIILTMLSIVAITGFYWGIYVSAIVLISYTHFSLPGVLKLEMEPIELPSVIVTAHVSLVPAPTLDVRGIKIPNPKYLKLKWFEYTKKH